MKKLLSYLLLFLLVVSCVQQTEEIPPENWFDHVPGTSISLNQLQMQGIGKADLLDATGSSYYLPSYVYVCYVSGDSVYYREASQAYSADKELRYDWKGKSNSLDVLYHHFCKEGIHMIEDYSDQLGLYYDNPELLIPCWREAYTFHADGSVEFEYDTFAKGAEYYQKLYGSPVVVSPKPVSRAESEVGVRTGRFVYCDASCVIVDYDYNPHLLQPVDGVMSPEYFLRVVYTSKEPSEAVVSAERRLEGPLTFDVVPLTKVSAADLQQPSPSADEFDAVVLGKAYMVTAIYECYESKGTDYYVAEYDQLASLSWLHGSFQSILAFNDKTADWYLAPGLSREGEIDWSFDATKAEITFGWPFLIGRIQSSTGIRARVRYSSEKYMILDVKSVIPSAEGATFSRVVLTGVILDDYKVDKEG
ncbi:MAG: hypothetical protein J6T94_11805 [Bacteroidaceae bacterium]|nr:hypothetical protein [Bacteroidaceae bacterium]